MTKTLSMVSHKNYNLNANEGFVIFLTSKLITCFIGGFTLIMKPKSIAHLLNGSEHIYWILDLEGEVHSIWDLWVSGLQECKSKGFFRNRAGPKNVFFFPRKGGCPRPILTIRKVRWGCLLASAQEYGGRLSCRKIGPMMGEKCLASNLLAICLSKMPTWPLFKQIDTCHFAKICFIPMVPLLPSNNQWC